MSADIFLTNPRVSGEINSTCPSRDTASSFCAGA